MAVVHVEAIINNYSSCRALDIRAGLREMIPESGGFRITNDHHQLGSTLSFVVLASDDSITNLIAFPSTPAAPVMERMKNIEMIILGWQ